MKTFSFAANKGGVGKTHLTIFMANYLAALGFKVVVLDMDNNNSSSYYYLTEDTIDEAQRKNSHLLLSSEDNKIEDYVIPTLHQNVYIIPSSRYLADLRTVSERRLNRIISNSSKEFNFIVIDCPPSYDNITLNAINASDAIISPVYQDLDSYNATVFLQDKIQQDTSKSGNFHLIVNGYNVRWADSIKGKQVEYINAYKDRFSDILLPSSCWLPWTADVKSYKDEFKSLTNQKGVRGAINNPKLYDSIRNLVDLFIGESKDGPLEF